MSDFMTQEYPSTQPRPQQTPSTSPPATPNPTQTKPDDINSPFETLDTSVVIAPYNADHSALPEFERSVADALMCLMMNVRAWSEARPAYEAAREKDHLVAEIGDIEARQQEQGRSPPSVLESIRQRLVGFIASVKTALDDLQG
ncbi:hypothetical protein FRC06_003892 [Ceratobasidium sp. 370]|nr:hypothetical protein FRC06_003892 [Ceratobasidium sp. 370]